MSYLVNCPVCNEKKELRDAKTKALEGGGKLVTGYCPTCGKLLEDRVVKGYGEK